MFGAAYLVWLAIATIRGARRAATSPGDAAAGGWYLRGVLISLSNPKVLLFFIAVLPQFMGDAQNAELQLAMLGAVNVSAEVLLYGAIGVLAGTFHAHSAGPGKGAAALSYFAASVYLVLAGVVVAEVLVGA